MANPRFIFENLVEDESMLSVSSLRNGLVTSAKKEGIGSAVITTSGNFRGPTDLEYIVEIDSIAISAEVGFATFKWSDGGGTWNATGVTTPATATELNYGTKIAFAGGAGADFVVGDKWYFKGINLFNARQMLDRDRDHIYRSVSLNSNIIMTEGLLYITTEGGLKISTEAGGLDQIYYRSNASLEDEDCSDISDWIDGDTGPTESTQVDNPLGGGLSTFKFDTKGSAAGNDYAQRTKNIGSIDSLGNRFVVSLRLYFAALGSLAGIDYLEVAVKRSDMWLRVRFATDGLFVFNGTTYPEIGTDIVKHGGSAEWQEWTFDVDVSAGVANAVCDVYLNNILEATDVDCSFEIVATDGLCLLILYGKGTDDRISYVDWFKVGDNFE